MRLDFYRLFYINTEKPSNWSQNPKFQIFGGKKGRRELYLVNVARTSRNMTGL